MIQDVPDDNSPMVSAACDMPAVRTPTDRKRVAWHMPIVTNEPMCLVVGLGFGDQAAVVGVDVEDDAEGDCADKGGGCGEGDARGDDAAACGFCPLTPALVRRMCAVDKQAARRYGGAGVG